MDSDEDHNANEGFQPIDNDLEYLPPVTLPAVGPAPPLFQHANTIAADREIYARHQADYQRYKRRQLRISVILFVLTLCSTFLVSSGYVPFRWLMTKVSPDYVEHEDKNEDKKRKSPRI